MANERASRPVALDRTPQQDAEAERRRADREEGEAKERRRQVRGLLLLAGVVLALSLARAGVDRVFPSGWWRLW